MLAVVDELVPCGSETQTSWRRQLDHLKERATRPNIAVRVVSNSGAHAGANGAFLLLRRVSGHKVVFLENLTSVLILEETHEINRYEEAIRLLVRRALSQEDSVERAWEQGELAQEQLRQDRDELHRGGVDHHSDRCPRPQAPLWTCAFVLT